MLVNCARVSIETVVEKMYTEKKKKSTDVCSYRPSKELRLNTLIENLFVWERDTKSGQS